MTLYVRSLSGRQEHYVITSAEDCEELFRRYPSTEDIFANSDSLAEAIPRIAHYLSHHNLDSWVEDADITKSIRNKAIALGLSAATAMTPNMAVPKQPSQEQTQHKIQMQQPKIAEFGKQPEDKFLWSVMQVESSGGRDTHHKVAGRIHKPEERAIGKWGLLKPTVDEMVKRNKLHKPIQNGEQLLNMNRDDMETYFKQHPDMELNVARALAHHVIGRQRGDLKRSAYAWLYGHNKHYNEIPNDALMQSDYVRKFKEYHKRNPFNPIQPAIHVIKKTEGSEIFKDRIKAWSLKRDAQTREPQPPPSNYAPDQGRMREKSLDKKPDNNPADVIPFLHQKIKDAKDGLKS